MATRRSERAASHASPSAPAARGRRSAAASPLVADLTAVEGVAAPPAEAPSWELPQLTSRASPSRDAVDALALSADGARLFTAGGARGAVRCWSAAQLGAPLLLWEAADNGHTGGVTALAVALDDRGVFSAGRDGEVRPARARARHPQTAVRRADDTRRPLASRAPVTPAAPRGRRSGAGAPTAPSRTRCAATAKAASPAWWRMARPWCRAETKARSASGTQAPASKAARSEATAAASPRCG